MKITLQPSEDQTGEEYPHATITIEIPGDDIELESVLDYLIRPALMAWGFHHETINQYLPE